jgi:Tfp pilus assembly protein PilF
MFRLKLISIILIAVIGASTIGVQIAKAQKIDGKYLQAKHYMEEGNIVEAEKTFEDIIALDVEQEKAYIGIASIFQEQGDVTRAEEVLKEVFMIVENKHELLEFLEAILTTQGKYDEVEKYKHLLAELEAEDGKVPNSLRELKERVQDAINEIDEIISVFNSDEIVQD